MLNSLINSVFGSYLASINSVIRQFRLYKPCIETNLRHYRLGIGALPKERHKDKLKFLN